MRGILRKNKMVRICSILRVGLGSSRVDSVNEPRALGYKMGTPRRPAKSHLDNAPRHKAGCYFGYLA
jgi:hypothetical protein